MLFHELYSLFSILFFLSCSSLAFFILNKYLSTDFMFFSKSLTLFFSIYFYTLILFKIVGLKVTSFGSIVYDVSLYVDISIIIYVIKNVSIILFILLSFTLFFHLIFLSNRAVIDYLIKLSSFSTFFNVFVRSG